MTTLIAVLTALKPLLAPLVTFLAGWLFPSPLQKKLIERGKVEDAEKKATATRGHMDDLDTLN